MSIINDALKKVQQGLDHKNNDAQAVPAAAKQNLWEAPVIENQPAPGQQSTNQKTPVDDKIKSILALSFAIIITVASVLYIFQQYQTNMPKVQTFASKSFNTFIHKIHPTDHKPKPPAVLGSLAQITISAKSAPITLNIHGIMSNSNGNLVLINDQVYQEGDTVDGAKILKIDLDSIKVANNGVEQTIFVKN